MLKESSSSKITRWNCTDFVTGHLREIQWVIANIYSWHFFWPSVEHSLQSFLHRSNLYFPCAIWMIKQTPLGWRIYCRYYFWNFFLITFHFSLALAVGLHCVKLNWGGIELSKSKQTSLQPFFFNIYIYPDVRINVTLLQLVLTQR